MNAITQRYRTLGELMTELPGARIKVGLAAAYGITLLLIAGLGLHLTLVSMHALVLLLVTASVGLVTSQAWRWMRRATARAASRCAPTCRPSCRCMCSTAALLPCPPCA